MSTSTVVDLFSGCGGLSLGFEHAGFNIVAAYDNWKPAVDTYQANFKHAINLKDLNGETTLPVSTVIIGGPPCQGFSSAGRRVVNDDRNSLVSVFARLIVRHKPLAFVFENVEGFLTQAQGRYIFDLLDPVIEAGYRVHLRKINAAHYGVPQHRKRVIAIGGLGWEPSFPPHTHSALGAPGSRLANSNHLPFAPSLGEALYGLASPQVRHNGDQDLFDHTYSPFNYADRERARLLREGQRMRDLPEELWHESYRKRAYRRVKDGTPTECRGGAPAGFRRLSLDEPSKAITGGSLRDFVHPTEDRHLTIRECARLQTFPDNFIFIGTQSEKIQMIGNAVPVRLAQRIAMSLKEDIKNASVVRDRGALISFIPTLSTGMSPVLKSVTDSVTARYIQQNYQEQALLCL